jgi:hypothetical protein
MLVFKGILIFLDFLNGPDKIDFINNPFPQNPIFHGSNIPTFQL